MTEANSVPAGGLTRWQQIDAARAEALAYYGQTQRETLGRGEQLIVSTGSIKGVISAPRRVLATPTETTCITPSARTDGASR